MLESIQQMSWSRKSLRIIKDSKVHMPSIYPYNMPGASLQLGCRIFSLLKLTSQSLREEIWSPQWGLAFLANLWKCKAFLSCPFVRGAHVCIRLVFLEEKKEKNAALAASLYKQHLVCRWQVLAWSKITSKLQPCKSGFQRKCWSDLHESCKLQSVLL